MKRISLSDYAMGLVQRALQEADAQAAMLKTPELCDPEAFRRSVQDQQAASNLLMAEMISIVREQS